MICSIAMIWYGSDFNASGISAIDTEHIAYELFHLSDDPLWSPPWTSYLWTVRSYMHTWSHYA